MLNNVGPTSSTSINKYNILHYTVWWWWWCLRSKMAVSYRGDEGGREGKVGVIEYNLLSLHPPPPLPPSKLPNTPYSVIFFCFLPPCSKQSHYSTENRAAGHIIQPYNEREHEIVRQINNNKKNTPSLNYTWVTHVFVTIYTFASFN